MLIFEKLGNQKFLECCKNIVLSRSNEAYHHIFYGLTPKDSYCSTQEFQLAVHIRVCILNGGILWAYKELFDECGLVIFKRFLRTLQNLLSRASLSTIYKYFIRPHLNYGDILYDQAHNMYFHQKLESFQYNARFTVTGAVRVTSKEKPYQDLGLESLQ